MQLGFSMQFFPGDQHGEASVEWTYKGESRLPSERARELGRLRPLLRCSAVQVDELFIWQGARVFPDSFRQNVSRA